MQKRLHHFRERDVTYLEEKVNVVGHERIGVQPHRPLLLGLVKKFLNPAEVFRLFKDGLPLIAPRVITWNNAPGK